MSSDNIKRLWVNRAACMLDGIARYFAGSLCRGAVYEPKVPKALQEEK